MKINVQSRLRYYKYVKKKLQPAKEMARKICGVENIRYISVDLFIAISFRCLYFQSFNFVSAKLVKNRKEPF